MSEALSETTTQSFFKSGNKKAMKKLSKIIGVKNDDHDRTVSLFCSQRNFMWGFCRRIGLRRDLGRLRRLERIKLAQIERK